MQRRPAPEPGPRQVVDELNTADSYRAWLTQIGLRDVRVDTAAHSIPLTAVNAWLVVLGSGYRGMLAGLDSSQVEQVRHAYLNELHRREQTHLDATSTIGLGTWPGCNRQPHKGLRPVRLNVPSTEDRERGETVTAG